MDGWAIIATFEAKQFSAGAITAKHMGMAIRIYVADEVLEDGLDLFYEVVGGSKEARTEFLEMLKKNNDATIKITQDRPDVMRFVACLNDLSHIKDHPVMKLELEQRFDIDRLWMVYEDGVCVMRNEFPVNTPEDVVRERRDRMAAICKESGITASVRIAPLDRQLEDWRPLPLQ